MATHTNGNMLDLVISCDDDDFTENVIVNVMIADCAIVKNIKLAISKARLSKKKVTLKI